MEAILDCKKIISEEDMEKCTSGGNWINFSMFQKLSEEFIEKNADKVNWNFIISQQKLSEKFIEKHFNIRKHLFCVYQKLSEEFIEKNSDEVYWYDISRYQKLSEKFRKKWSNKLSTPSSSWLYKSGDEKLKFIKDSGKYKIDGDYVYAYKGIRSDRYSKHNFQYQYHVGKTYTCHADHNPENENSFGLSAWTLDEARRYCDELIVLVKIHKDDLAALVHDSNKIRCSKFTIIEDIERN